MSCLVGDLRTKVFCDIDVLPPMEERESLEWKTLFQKATQNLHRFPNVICANVPLQAVTNHFSICE